MIDGVPVSAGPPWPPPNYNLGPYTPEIEPLPASMPGEIRLAWVFAGSPALLQVFSGAIDRMETVRHGQRRKALPRRLTAACLPAVAPWADEACELLEQRLGAASDRIGFGCKALG